MGILRKLSFLFHVDSLWTDYADQDNADYKGIMLPYVANVFNELKYLKALQLCLAALP